jgi:hypothetical protein
MLQPEANVMKAIRFPITLVLAAGLVLGACHKSPSQEAAPSADNSAQPSQPAADTAATASQPTTETPAAGAATTPPVPDPKLTHATPSQTASQAASHPTAAQAPPPPKPKPVVIPAGTVIAVRLQQPLGSKTSQEGQHFEASIAAPVMIGGKTVVPTGSTAYGRVTQAHPAGRFKGGATLAVELTDLRVNGLDYPIQSTAVAQGSKGKGKRTATMIGGGAGGGALIGGLAGGGKGAAIGALVGAGAGTVGSAFTGGNRDISLPAESALSFELTAPLTLKASNSDSQD